MDATACCFRRLFLAGALPLPRDPGGPSGLGLEEASDSGAPARSGSTFSMPTCGETQKNLVIEMATSKQ